MLKETERNEEIINKLILVGRYLESNQGLLLDNMNYFKEYDWINSCGPEYWLNLINDMGIKDLEYLIKGLTQVEKHLQWGASSVASVIWLYRLYEKKYAQGNSNLADWILRNTNNCYLPFGTMNRGGHSVKECNEIRNRQWLNQRQKELKDQEDSKQRKIIRAEQIILYNKLHQEKAIERRKYLSIFTNLDKLEQLKIIAYDKDRPVDYYPIECTRIGNEVLSKLGKTEKNVLIDRLSNRRKGEWAEFYKRLI